MATVSHSPRGQRKTTGSMRRHHFLSLSDANLLSASDKADHHHRRRSTQLPLSPRNGGGEMHRRLHSVFGGTVPGEAHSQCSSTLTDDEHDRDNAEDPTDGSFLNRITSYSRLMHTYTKSQLARPDFSTLPSYQKTMHAFTLNQLNSHHASQSETSSPRLAPPAAAALRTLMPVERLSAANAAKAMLQVPAAPGNTPDIGGVKGEGGGAGRDFRKLKRRSVTDPEAVRNLVAEVRARDFAALG